MDQDRVTGAALLRQGYERIVRELGPRLSELTASEGFAEAAEMTSAAQARLRREIERRSRRFLHFWNLPAGSDVTVLRREIGELERQVRDLTKRLEDADRVSAPSQPPKRASGRSTKSTSKGRRGAAS